MPKRTTIRDIQKKVDGGGRVSMVTAYDAFSARLVDAAGIDMALVGDSVGSTVQGRADTLAVTMQQMLYHTEIVARCAPGPLVVGDMPFGSFQSSPDEAISNAVNFLKAGANAVKLEGGAAVGALVARMTRAGIPVVGHLGYTPQSVNQTSGARLNKEKEDLLQNAQRLADAGAFAIVLEMVPAAIAKEVTAAVNIPTIGIGAGAGCDGQVLVFFDMLGFSPEFSPRFLKRYMDFHGQALAALKQYKSDVEDGSFPAKEHSY
ncbi:MAG: 3-methyl-2-oxobutanoate hydroxymethyltransferase [Planctomycetes bacterium]|nr:3-methyl-2-oxobutanoate hydroxymethyltransferase [Planctomycetota bacterium]